MSGATRQETNLALVLKFDQLTRPKPNLEDQRHFSTGRVKQNSLQQCQAVWGVDVNNLVDSERSTVIVEIKNAPFLDTSFKDDSLRRVTARTNANSPEPSHGSWSSVLISVHETEGLG